MPLPVEEAINALIDSDKPLLSSRLVELSNLNAQELALFEKAWQTIEPKRRRQIIYRLVELAEDNFELDFEGIFKRRLKDEDAAHRPPHRAAGAGKCRKSPGDGGNCLGQVRHARRAGKAPPQTQDQGLPCPARRHRRHKPFPGNPLSLPQMEKAIARAYQSGVPRLKTSAIFAMGKNCDLRWLPILIRELTNADAEIRYEAAQACGELGEKEAAPYLSELTTDPDIDVQLAAIQALGRIGGPEAKDSLERCLTDDSEVIQQAAEEALAELEAGEDPLSFRM